MNNYTDGVEYLHALGFPVELSKKICEKFERDQDMEGLVNYIFLCETLVDSCVD